jgi:hypothetical protein
MGGKIGKKKPSGAEWNVYQIFTGGAVRVHLTDILIPDAIAPSGQNLIL